MKFPRIILIALLCCACGAQAGELPKTLFEMVGVKSEPGKLSNSVLVIIDAQREYVDGALPLVGVSEAIAEIGKLVTRARKSGTPVVHVVHRGKGTLFNPGSSGFEIVAALQPLPNEAVVEKMRTSAFAETGLEKVIQRSGRRSLIIAGFMTHNCVSSTARAARDLGYVPTVVASATATRDLPDGRNGVIAASVLQASSLAALADRTATVVPAQQDISD
ncbi:MAG TPA: cysteine hydrolase family protein [Gallionella sp.]|nr:cysteine hydrolase family protein [Gallionella sp.]